jgi:hypothetical protein
VAAVENDLVAELGDFEMIETRSQKHDTPVGVVQPFTWVVARVAERRKGG